MSENKKGKIDSKMDNLKSRLSKLKFKIGKKDDSSELEPKVPESENRSQTEIEAPAESVTNSLLEPIKEEKSYSRTSYSFEEFVDERILVSHDIFGKKEMKIKVLEVSDEHPPVQWRFGDRVKVNKILVTIKHLDTQEVEEGEFDIESIEKELTEKRHYTSTNRWIPTTEIKNGYIVASRHTSLISDAVALDYITF